jgi:cellulose synthase/poly-beta-1,6-N-acetylglucosamine synthase-like glycosyltransferase
MEQTVNGKRVDDESSVIATPDAAVRSGRVMDPQRDDASENPQRDEAFTPEPREDNGESALFYEPEFLEAKPAEPQPHAPTEMRLYDYERYGRLAGPQVEPGEGVPTVGLVRPAGARPRRQLAVAALVMTIQTAFLAWLFLPDHRPGLSHSGVLDVGSIVMIISIYAIELFRFVNVSSLCIASALARDPIPMPAQPGTRVAFLTTIVPSKEPIELLRKTLEAALAIRHDGVLDVWLLDEENSPSVGAMCREFGVHHFSRHGVEGFNQPSGPFKAKTKHGNYNSWVAAHGDEYEYFVSVDPDHVPLPNFCERLLGYFRDPGVAFVVGPQVYGNYDNFVTKGAESQQFVFHGLIQRLGNYFGCPMLVGTNNAVRISALREIGGLRDSITEDLATSLSFHAQRSDSSGVNWRSVYTPDVLAVGEGPSNFTDFFSQQHRWSRGTFENFRGHYWRSMRGLRWGPRLHYALITSYYPSAAIGWILGGVNCVIYLILGAKGLQITPRIWLAVYLDLAVVQLCLYASNRRYNVSPHEAPGSSGAVGMLMSVMAAPIYVVAFIQSVLKRRQGFVITPKGDLQSVDRISTFRLHLGWAALFIVALGVSLRLDRPQSGMRMWSLGLILVCLTPWLLSLLERRRGHQATQVRRSVRARLAAARRDDPAPSVVPQTEAA